MAIRQRFTGKVAISLSHWNDDILLKLSNQVAARLHCLCMLIMVRQSLSD